MKSIKSLLGILAISLFCFATNKTERTITGKVTDEKGAVVAGATVKLCNSKKATSTNAQGAYSITIDEKTTCLTFSGIALQSQTIAIKESNVIDVKMMLNNFEMNEVVVQVPYGSVKKTSYTGSEGTISAKAFSGQISGLSVTNSGSASGSNTTIKIRGIGSLSNSNTSQWKNDKNDEEKPNREGYDKITENVFLSTKQNPLSTFSIDVDAASYSNVRRILNAGNLPPAGAVRIEEMINYFEYDYPQPTNNLPFTINTEQSICPWNTKHQLVLVGLQGKKIDEEKLPSASLTFLIDVSGSMQGEGRLPLVKSSLLMLVNKLREQDKVAIVVYAGAAGLVLPSTSDKESIRNAITRLEAGGSTAGGAGIKLAYKTAKDNFTKGGNNRVILCTDGDFNVGTSSDDELERMIEEERKSNVFLTVLGFGMGNYQDAKMQKLADKGNGNHAYIDGINEAKKVFLNEFGGTLFTIAKDVKFQIEFNPKQVKEYRLIGYENRMLAKEDFNNDKKDAGELGSGHTVTALYEIVPAGTKEDLSTKVDELRYQENETIVTDDKKIGEMMSLKLRYKNPDDSTSKLIERIVKKRLIKIEQASENLRFAAAVAEFGMMLRNSEHKKNSSYEDAKQLATNALGKDVEGYRKELIELINKTMLLDKTVRK
jgi:Ca-activated chloride channel family protein